MTQFRKQNEMPLVQKHVSELFAEFWLNSLTRKQAKLVVYKVIEISLLKNSSFLCLMTLTCLLCVNGHQDWADSMCMTL